MFEVCKGIIDMFFVYFMAFYNFQIELYSGVYVKLGHICLGISLVIVLISYVFHAIGGGDSD